MGILTAIFDTVTLPIDIVKDVITGGEGADEEDGGGSAVMKKLKDIKEDLQESI